MKERYFIFLFPFSSSLSRRRNKKKEIRNEGWYKFKTKLDLSYYREYANIFATLIISRIREYEYINTDFIVGVLIVPVGGNGNWCR